MSTFVVAVAVVIVRAGTVLAMRRSPHKDAGAGLWETLSGRLEIDEQPLDAIAREIEEECGLSVEIDRRPIDAYTARRNETPMFVIFFRAQYVGGEVRRSGEHDAHAWMTPEEFRAKTPFALLADAVDRAMEK